MSLVGMVAVGASCSDDNGVHARTDVGTESPTSAADWGVEFVHEVIDADPPSGESCCLDVVTTGDIDGDTLDDIVVGSEHADGWSWYRNPGDGEAMWTRFPSGEGDFTTDGETLDIDTDGDLDVILSSTDPDELAWWEQVGDATDPAGWERHEIGGEHAHDLLLADVDGDGQTDVVAAHFDAGHVTWYQAPDDPREPWIGHEIDSLVSEGLAPGDVDGDGDLDLVSGPAVYLNDDGSGTSWTRVELASDWSEQARAAVGDVDGDGNLDVVLAHDETEGRLAWFSGPTWDEHVIDDEAGYAHSLEVGDIDGDGVLDIFVGRMHTADEPEVRVLFGDGGTEWTPVMLSTAGTHNAQLVDLDGDGRLDVVGKNYDGPKVVEVWWNREPALGPLDGFTYVEVDDDRARFNDDTAFFGLTFGDFDADGDADIASGGYIYLDPGGDVTSPWERIDLSDQVGTVVDAMLTVDVDGDDNPDLIAEALPDVWWFESEDGGRTWTGQVVAEVPATPRPNGQGYRAGDLVGDERPEIVLSGGSNESDVWYLTIPADPGGSPWPAVRITATATDEQIGIGDVDGDGDNDVVAGDMRDGGSFIAWFENPGDDSADWTRHRLGPFDGAYPDRLDVADFNGDGRLDVVVTEENEGTEADADVTLYLQPDDPNSGEWTRQVVVTQYTTNGLDVVDLDGDGDVDLVTGEHRGRRRVAIWENTGLAPSGEITWTEHVVDEGKESHLGARTVDLDRDGDFDIVSIGFDEPQFLHLWVND